MSDIQIVRTVSQTGRVTLPAEIRRRLGIVPGGHVAFIVKDDQVIVKPVAETLRSVCGAVAPLHRPEDWQAARDAALEDKVDRTLRDLLLCDEAPKWTAPGP